MPGWISSRQATALATASLQSLAGLVHVPGQGHLPHQWQNQGSIFRSENVIYSTAPFWKWYFFHLSRHVIFYSHHGLFAFILPYFAIILSFYFPFSNFLSPFFLFLFPFFFFLLHFPPFSFHISPPNDIGWYFPPPRGGGGIFQYIGPWAEPRAGWDSSCHHCP